MDQRERGLRSIGEVIADRNIELVGFDPISSGGFTQVPNFILENPALSLGAKVTYAMFLRFVWHNDYCFPGQDRLGDYMGMSKSRVNEFVKELERSELIEIQRRGQGRTNIYKIKFVVKRKRKRPNS